MIVKQNAPGFPIAHLKSLLQSDNIACVIGYGLSDGYSPHFFDIQCGVWSNDSSNIDPFVDLKAYHLVIDWFNWRKTGVNKEATNSALLEAFALRQKLNAIIATQNVDGLHRKLKPSDVYELYGCIDDSVTLETNHTEKSFPDVDMFGRNSKAEIRSKFIHDLQQAKLLIAIGVDRRLCPFRDPNYHSLNTPTVEITHTHIYFYNNNQTSRLTFKEMQAEVRNIEGHATFELSRFEMAIKAIGLLSDSNNQYSI